MEFDNNPNNESDESNIKTVLSLFPYLSDKSVAVNLKIDNESIHYISLREYAEKISEIIAKHLKMINIKPMDAVITDATAGVGGNTLSFAKIFKHVHAIEIDKLRCDYLQNNVNVYKFSNVDVLQNDCTLLLNKIDDHDVIFIDPPWGGKNYKDHKNLKLSLSNISIELLCNLLMKKEIMVKIPELIVLKLPKNYDVSYLYNSINKKKIYYYDLKKMILIIIHN